MGGRSARRLVQAALLAGFGLAAASGVSAEEEQPPGEAQPAASSADAWWDLSGDVAIMNEYSYPKHRSSSGTDYQGLVGLRTKLGLQLDLELPWDWQARAAGSGFYDFAYLARDRDDYTNEVLDKYEWDADVGELWVEGPLLPSLDLKVGRQVVNWGRSDTLRVLDVLNPIDNRQPGLLDLVDLRLPVTMAKASYYPDPHWALTGIYIPEIRFSIDPPFGSDFFEFGQPLPPQTISSGFTASHPEWAASLSGNFEGWDISFHFASAYEDVPRLEPGPAGGFQLEHSRVLLGGVGGNYAFGTWLVKGELAAIDGIDFATTGEKTRFDSMLGVEYYGFPDNNIALEIVFRHLDDFQSSMKGFPDFAKQNVVETSLRWGADWWNARLHTTALAVVFGARAQDGSVLRFTADYDIRDGLSFGAGIQIWLEGTESDGFLNPFKKNDRVFLRLKYSF